MSTAYKVLSTWWRLVLLCGLLVVGASSVLVVPVAQAQEPLPSLWCRIPLPPNPPEPEPEPCTVIVGNRSNINMSITVVYTDQNRARTLSYWLQPGETITLANVYGLDYVEAFQTTSGPNWIPLPNTRERFLWLDPIRDLSIGIMFENGRFDFQVT